MSKSNVPDVSTLFIDKISFTCNPVIGRPAFVAHAKQVQQVFQERGQVKNAYNIQGFRYRSSYRLVNGGNQIALCQLDPVQEKVAAFRMEYNPANLATGDGKVLKEHLQGLFLDEYHAVMSHARITQIDVAVDIANVQMGELLVSERRRRKSAVWGKEFDRNGALETVYLGAPRSDEQIRVYNKEVQLRVSGGPDLGYRLTRVEAVLIPRVPVPLTVADKGDTTNPVQTRYQSGILLHQTGRLENPFARIQLASVSALEKLGAHYRGRLFLACCHHNGTQSALNILPDALRKRYVKRLLRAEFDWWQPETIWKSLDDALKSLGIFPDSAFEAPAD